MNREIKFRALYHSIMPHGEKIASAWAYGNLSYVGDKVVQIFDQHKTGSVFNCYPGTQGQYTGLKDKNGKEVYEGDVVLTSGYQNPFSGETENCACVVEYLGPHLIYRASADNHETVYNLIGNADKDDDAEVIGNVHENPELLQP